jgi:formylglycine-generating enzyme required for sulfatase activity
MIGIGAIATMLLICTPSARALGTQLLVSNVHALQRPGTALIDVTFDLETVDDVLVDVHLFLSPNSGTSYPYLCHTVSGDVGSSVSPGLSRHIVWDAGADFPTFSSATCCLRVTADDAPDMARFAYVPPGTFMMGSPASEPERLANETQHQVTLTHGIYVQNTEVTNQQFRDMVQWAYDRGYVTATYSSVRDNLDGSYATLNMMGTQYAEIYFNAGVFSCSDPNSPVMTLTWYGAVAYCDWLSLQQGLPRAYNHATWTCNGGDPYAATGYRLPTEAEWEFACRAGTQTPFSGGSCLSSVDDANYDGRFPYTGCEFGPQIGWTTTVARYPANAFGLYDMHGNLYEWCNDNYGAYSGNATDPVGTAIRSSKAVRGGNWAMDAGHARSAARSSQSENTAWYAVGFRPVRTAH